MTVLIFADDPEFSRDLVGRLQARRGVPAFTVLSGAAAQSVGGEFDLAVVRLHPPERLLPLLHRLKNSSTAPVLCLAADATVAQTIAGEFPRILVLRCNEGWLDAAVLVAEQVLCRVEAATRARHAEEAAAAEERYATLGRYMLEMRHSVNNALTSVLGHAELLLLDAGAFSTEVREQLNTIHSMALRMHKILQRFSSLNAEMQHAEREKGSETQVS